MRIVHYMKALRLADGGVVRAVIDLASAVADLGHDLTILTNDCSDAPEPWRMGTGRTRVIDMGPEGPLVSLSRPQRRQARLAVAEADVCHIHGNWKLAGHQIARICREAGVPYIISCHGQLDDWSVAQGSLKKKAFYELLGGKRALRGAAAVHCTAKAELSQARKWFDPAPGVVVPLVFNLDPYRELPGPDPARQKLADALPADQSTEPVVLFLSRLHYKKGPDVFIRTMGELRRKSIACRGILAGTGDDEYTTQLKQLARTEGVDDRIRFVGLVSGAEKTSLYELADVFALPTSQENFGFVFPEALACATPVVTTPDVDLHEELNASGGAVITERTPAAFAGAIASLLADPERRTNMGSAGRAWVFDELDPDKVARRFESMYRDVALTRPIDPAPTEQAEAAP